AETGQVGQLDVVETLLEVLDEGQRILAAQGFHQGTVGFDADVKPANPQHRAARQADHRVATPLFTALNGLEQVGIRAPGELEIGAYRRFKIGEYFPGDGDASVPTGRQCSKLL